MNKDTIGGLVMLVLGTGTAWIASGYALGTWMRIGPGTFPLLIGLGIAGLGVLILLKGIIAGGEELESIPWRPLAVIPAAMVVFALALPRLGLVISCFLLVGAAALARPGLRWVEVLLLSAGLAAFSVAVFVWGLRLPLRIWPA